MHTKLIFNEDFFYEGKSLIELNFGKGRNDFFNDFHLKIKEGFKNQKFKSVFESLLF